MGKISKEETIDLISKFGTSYEPKNEKIEALIGEAATSITKNEAMDGILYHFAKGVYQVITLDKISVGQESSNALDAIMKHSNLKEQQLRGIGSLPFLPTR